MLVREHVLPTGHTHIVFRSPAGPGVQLLDGTGSAVSGTALPSAVVGGPRTRFYARQAGLALRSAGMLLRPGAVQRLLGVPAHAVAGQHVALADLWGEQALEMHEELMAIADPAQRLIRLEAILLDMLGTVATDPLRGARPASSSLAHPAVLRAVRGLSEAGRVGPWVQDMSHRHFIQLFRDAVGLTPKAFARVQRARAALRAVVQPGAVLAQVAVEAGYADQAHFQRDVREIAGVSPAVFVKLAPSGGSHVPMPPSQNNSRQSH